MSYSVIPPELWKYLVASYFVTHMANFLLLIKAIKMKSAQYISYDTQVLQFTANIARIFWFNDTDVPYIGAAWAEVVAGLILNIVMIMLCHRLKDTKKTNVPSYLKWQTLFMLAVLLAYKQCRVRYNSQTECFALFTSFADTFSMVAQLHHLWFLKRVEGYHKGYVMIRLQSHLMRVTMWAKFTDI